jgi:ABC-type Zn uptake system ZnuABC Zn-binding protein ZnuA
MKNKLLKTITAIATISLFVGCGSSGSSKNSTPVVSATPTPVATATPVVTTAPTAIPTATATPVPETDGKSLPF